MDDKSSILAMEYVNIDRRLIIDRTIFRMNGTEIIKTVITIIVFNRFTLLMSFSNTIICFCISNVTSPPFLVICFSMFVRSETLSIVSVFGIFITKFDGKFGWQFELIVEYFQSTCNRSIIDIKP
jgi:hypothetical protein